MTAGPFSDILKAKVSLKDIRRCTINSLYLDLDQGMKQEQYQDLLREAEHYRLIKAVAQPGPNHFQKVAAALCKAMVGPTALLRHRLSASGQPNVGQISGKGKQVVIE